MMCGQIQTLKSHQKQARPPHIPPNPHAQHQTRGPTACGNCDPHKRGEKTPRKRARHPNPPPARPRPRWETGARWLDSTADPGPPACVRPSPRSPTPRFFLKKTHTQRHTRAVSTSTRRGTARRCVRPARSAKPPGMAGAGQNRACARRYSAAAGPAGAVAAVN